MLKLNLCHTNQGHLCYAKIDNGGLKINNMQSQRIRVGRIIVFCGFNIILHNEREVFSDVQGLLICQKKRSALHFEKEKSIGLGKSYNTNISCRKARKQMTEINPV